MTIKHSTDIDKIKAKNYLTENSSIDEIFEGINKENFNSEELKKFIQDNISFFSSNNFRQKLIDKGAKLANKNDMIMVIFLITFIDSINEHFDQNKDIAKELDITKGRIDEVIKMNDDQKKIIESYMRKDIERKKLEEEIALYKEIAKKQSTNLKENIGTIELLENTIERHKKLGLQLNSLIKEAKELGIFIEVANSRGELRINTIAVSAIEKQSIHTNSERTSTSLNESISKGSIIKAGDSREVEKFEFKEIGNKNEEIELEELSDPISIKLILDRITELETKESNDEKEKIRLNKELKKEKKKTSSVKKQLELQETKLELMEKRLNEQESLLLKHRIKTTGLTIIDEEKKD